MNLYKFYLWDDPVLYHWQAPTMELACEEIQREWELDSTAIEVIALVEPVCRA
jgi:hypothetical protein